MPKRTPSKSYKLTIRTLKPGWHDRDKVILHAAFQCLVDFVEGEDPFKVTDWSSNKVHQMAKREIRQLYHWWMKDRPKRVSPLNSVKNVPDLDELNSTAKKFAPWRKACQEQAQCDKRWEKEDELMLIRLIKVRQFLWT
jgi:hypothetical protein